MPISFELAASHQGNEVSLIRFKGLFQPLTHTQKKAHS